jgi:hypothetical protein
MICLKVVVEELVALARLALLVLLVGRGLPELLVLREVRELLV